MLEALRPDILAKELMTERERKSVFRNLVYQGPMIGTEQITKYGDTVRIPGIGRPTVNSYTGSSITYQENTATEQILTIDQSKYVAEKIDQVDDKQSYIKVMNRKIQQAKLALAEDVDEFLAGMYQYAGDTVANTNCVSTSIISSVSEAERLLLEANVPEDEMMNLVVSPAIYEKMKLARIQFEVTNKEVFRKGFKGGFLNFNVYVSNSIQKDAATGLIHYCMAFTGEAIGFAEQIPASRVKIVELENYFADGFKVLNLYGGKVIKPNELVCLALTPGSETAI